MTNSCIKFLCKECGTYKSRVTDSRSVSTRGVPYGYIKRRRKCLNCGTNQMTYETTNKPAGQNSLEAQEILDKIKNYLEIATVRYKG